TDNRRVAIASGLHEQPHGKRRDLPSPGDDRAEPPRSRRFRIGLNGLWVVLACVADDIILRNLDRLAFPGLTDDEIFTEAWHLITSSPLALLQSVGGQTPGVPLILPNSVCLPLCRIMGRSPRSAPRSSSG